MSLSNKFQWISNAIIIEIKNDKAAEVHYETIFQSFENSGINLMSDSQYNGQTRVQVLLEYLQERVMDLEDLGSVRRIKLEQCIQLCQFEADANQVLYITLNLFNIQIVPFTWNVADLLESQMLKAFFRNL